MLKPTDKKIITYLRIFICITFIAASILQPTQVNAGSRSIPTSGGNRSTTWVDIPFDGSYKILGLTAREVLGRDTGTLSDFAYAMAHLSGTDTIIFPVNYFYAYGGPYANNIIGQITSNRQLANDSYFDQGVGFRGNNHMFLFNFYRADTALIRADQTYVPLGFSPATSFNVFPHLIQNGARLPIEPMPGFNQAMVNNRVQRAFMGQRADGSLVVGNISSASAREVQDVAAYFNLVNAVNIDGGASAGIWRNGTYLARPGRQLASVAFITNTRFNVTLNGTPLQMDAYVQNINGRLMLPLSAALQAFGFNPWHDPSANTLTITRGDSRVTYFIGTTTIQVDEVFHAVSEASVPGGAQTLAPLQLIADMAGISVTAFPEGRLVTFNGVVVTEPTGEASTVVAPPVSPTPSIAPSAPATVTPMPTTQTRPSPCVACDQIFGYCPCPACPC